MKIEPEYSETLDENDLDGNSFDAVMKAIQFGCLEQVQALIATSLQNNFPLGLNFFEYGGYTALKAAMYQGHLGIIQELVRAGANPNFCGSSDISPLIVAVLQKHPAAVTALARAATQEQLVLNFNFTNSRGDTALMCAVIRHDASVMTALLEAAAESNQALDFEIAAPYRYTALQYAVEHNHWGTVSALVRAGADPNGCGTLGCTPLMIAAASNSLATLAVLAQAAADMNKTLDFEMLNPGNGMTALQYAIKHHHLATVTALVHAGADPNGRGTGDCTPLMIAAVNNCAAAVAVLAQAAADSKQELDFEMLHPQEGMTALQYAIHHHHLDTVTALVHMGADLNGSGAGGCTPLMYAAACNNAAAVAVLAQAAADSKQTLNFEMINPQDGMTALQYAIHHHHLDTVTALVQAGANPNGCDAGGCTPLMYAAVNNCAAAVAVLAQAATDSKQRLDFEMFHPQDGMTALQYAIRHHHLDTVTALVKAGANPNGLSPGGGAPLMIAATCNSAAAVAVLAQAAAESKQALHFEMLHPQDGMTALQYAIRHHHLNTVTALVKAGANPNGFGTGGGTPLMIAAECNKSAAVTVLAQAAADSEQRLNFEMFHPQDGMTALQYATQHNHLNTLTALVQAGADPNGCGALGCTPLMYAARNNRVAAVAVLAQAAADVNKTLDFEMLHLQEGRTALQYAIGFSQLDAVTALVHAGADPNGCGTGGCTPLMIAAACNSSAAVAVLAQAAADLNKTLDFKAQDSERDGGYTALSHAVIFKHKETIAALVRAGAGPHDLNRDKTTAMTLAQRIDNAQVLQALGNTDATGAMDNSHLLLPAMMSEGENAGQQELVQGALFEPADDLPMQTEISGNRLANFDDSNEAWHHGASPMQTYLPASFVLADYLPMQMEVSGNRLANFNDSDEAWYHGTSPMQSPFPALIELAGDLPMQNEISGNRLANFDDSDEPWLHGASPMQTYLSASFELANYLPMQNEIYGNRLANFDESNEPWLHGASPMQTYLSGSIAAGMILPPVVPDTVHVAVPAAAQVAVAVTGNVFETAQSLIGT